MRFDELGSCVCADSMWVFVVCLVLCWQIEHDRPEFKGDTMVSFVDGSPMTYYPPEVMKKEEGNINSKNETITLTQHAVGVRASIHPTSKFAVV